MRSSRSLSAILIASALLIGSARCTSSRSGNAQNAEAERIANAITRAIENDDLDYALTNLPIAVREADAAWSSETDRLDEFLIDLAVAFYMSPSVTVEALDATEMLLLRSLDLKIDEG